MQNKAKKTSLLAEELRAVSRTLNNEYNAQILIEAAERLGELYNIAKFFRKEAIKNKKG